MSETETLNQVVPVEILFRWQIAETNRERERADRVAEYAKRLESQVRKLEGENEDLRKMLADGPGKVTNKRVKKLHKHMREYLGRLNNEVMYIHEIISILDGYGEEE